MEKIKIGLSRCLLGDNVRYDGGHRQDRYVTDTLGKYFDWVPVCPEVEYGLPVPREAMRLVGDPESPRLVTVHSGVDHTEGMRRWAGRKLDELAGEGLLGFIFKSKSPSCGMAAVKVHSPAGTARKAGVGILAAAFMERFPLIPCEEDERLYDPVLRENFIERVFVFKRWADAWRKGRSAKTLADFHRDHKLLIAAHSPVHLSRLDRLVATPDRRRLQETAAAYIALLMETLKLIATVRKNTNVLRHMAGYLKKRLKRADRQELLETIANYRRGMVPLIVPVVLLQHYVRMYDEPCLERQVYLNPRPLELMLRNHV